MLRNQSFRCHSPSIHALEFGVNGWFVIKGVCVCWKEMSSLNLPSAGACGRQDKEANVLELHRYYLHYFFVPFLVVVVVVVALVRS